MKSERRHELQHNQLADWLAEMIARGQKYSQALVATIVGVAVLAGLYVFLTGRTARQEATAWARYVTATDSSAQSLDALTDLANQLPKTRGGQWARLALADGQLAQGLQQLFEDRAPANISLGSAIENYLKLRTQTTDMMLQERAALGLGRAYEGLNKLTEARDEYNTLVKRFRSSVYVEEAKRRLADLDREDTREFYAWFARQDPKPAANPHAGGPPPGQKPSFDLNNLPAEGPLFEMPNPLKDSPKDTKPRDDKPADPK